MPVLDLKTGKVVIQDVQKIKQIQNMFDKFIANGDAEGRGDNLSPELINALDSSAFQNNSFHDNLFKNLENPSPTERSVTE